MRKTILFVGAIAAMLSQGADVAQAQARPFTIGISAGPSLPSGGEFAEEAETGYHAQASIGFAPTTLPIGVRLDLLWQQFPDEHEGSFREIGGLANAVLALPLPLGRPYLLAGAGAVNHDAPEEEHGDHVHEGEGGTAFAYAVGGGLEFPLLGLMGTLEARYLAAGNDHGSIPISAGIRF